MSKQRVLVMNGTSECCKAKKLENGKMTMLIELAA